MKRAELHIYKSSTIPEVRMEGGGSLPEAENPDARVVLIQPDGTAIAHAAMWWRDTPLLDGVPVGTIGAFAALDGGAAEQILQAAMTTLREAGCSVAVGPMNGNTWRSYRFVTESSDRKSFLLEPRNTDGYPAWWRGAGFRDLSHYTSSVMPLDGVATFPARLRERLEKSGLVIRKIDPTKFDEELELIYELSLKCFTKNFLYTPLGKEAFVGGYQRIKERVDEDFVRIAERGGVACGFIFGIADLEATLRGEKPALIVKTLAVDPASRCAGLGSLLVDEIHQSAWRKGYTEAIHALQHETNTSLKITGRHQGNVFRRYTLFYQGL